MLVSAARLAGRAVFATAISINGSSNGTSNGIVY